MGVMDEGHDVEAMDEIIRLNKGTMNSEDVDLFMSDEFQGYFRDIWIKGLPKKLLNSSAGRQLLK